MDKELEFIACTPQAVLLSDFNSSASLPYGLSNEHIFKAMVDFTDFLGSINLQLYSKELERLESLLMPANFSSIVGEFMSAGIPKYCTTLVKNRYHNGHPDLIPASRYVNDSVQYSHEGIEIKASRYKSGWQGHNPEDVWLMVFVFDSNRPVDKSKNIPPRPFRFVEVLGATLTKADWVFSGRSETSRRTITASVTPAGYTKMAANWIYRAKNLE
jgi:hypothetical protein